MVKPLLGILSTLEIAIDCHVFYSQSFIQFSPNSHAHCLKTFCLFCSLIIVRRIDCAQLLGRLFLKHKTGKDTHEFFVFFFAFFLLLWSLLDNCRFNGKKENTRRRRERERDWEKEGEKRYTKTCVGYLGASVIAVCLNHSQVKLKLQHSFPIFFLRRLFLNGAHHPK